MSHRLGHVVSDLSHSNSRRGAAGQHGLRHHQSTTTASNTDGRGNAGRTRQRLAFLFSGVVAWTRSESSGETGSSSSREKNRKQQQQQQTANGGGRAGARRRGLDIVLALRKSVSMVEQLFASYSGGGGSARRDGDGRDARRRRPHTFTYARGSGGGASSSSSRRHKQGRLSSAPASLRGSPANSGHLAVGESVARKASTPSEVSTMEELHSAIQAAIAHCKQSSAGGEQQPPPRA